MNNIKEATRTNRPVPIVLDTYAMYPRRGDGATASKAPPWSPAVRSRCMRTAGPELPGESTQHSSINDDGLGN
eukprot:6182159-Pleurochrysis_carterae.AAC.5